MNNNHVDAIRQAALTDLDAIMPLFDAARAFMIKAGNPNQWINGYPERKLIESEIEQGHCYVCEDKNKRIAATFCFIPGEDPTYKQIEGGTWLNDKPYAVLHRLASDGTLSRVADSCLKWCFLHTDNLRVDTHQDNKVLQHILLKHGFTYCGIIYVSNGTPRLAYQKTNNQ